MLRTSNRPQYFKSCIDSIFQQTYKNICILVSYDNHESYDYIKKHKGIKSYFVSYQEDHFPEQEILRGTNLKKFPANLYLNTLMDQVSKGYIIYLDDDDCFSSPHSVQTIVDQISDKDDLIFWRVQFPDDKIIPEDEYFGKAPVFWHIAGNSFAFHHKYIPDAQWDGWKGGDFVVATKLYQRIPNKIYINKVLTALQRKESWGGFGDKMDKKEENGSS
ncbi:MAG: glycosyltransferase [Bacteroidales bacterium]|nr:glycosyltransferase [Bacteroidales bacterium]